MNIEIMINLGLNELKNILKVYNVIKSCINDIQLDNAERMLHNYQKITESEPKGLKMLQSQLQQKVYEKRIELIVKF